jgi:ribulose-5-phosphate 4-epimerase/fuculose-1-phosphate aldolase
MKSDAVEPPLFARTPMANTNSNAIKSLVEANRILVAQSVLDAFGHVSVRSPESPESFFLSRSLAPELVTLEDIVEYDLNSAPVSISSVAHYSERFIHGAIYRSRPDVHAICHHHAAQMMPYCLTDLKLQVVTQLGACIGTVSTPVWDQRDDFGATNHLVTTPEQAMSLAACLQSFPMVLMKRHGATAVGSNIQELVFRCIYSCRNASMQLDAAKYGRVDVFTAEEVALASKFPDSTVNRAWDYWRVKIGG